MTFRLQLVGSGVNPPELTSCPTAAVEKAHENPGINGLKALWILSSICGKDRRKKVSLRSIVKKIGLYFCAWNAQHSVRVSYFYTGA